MKCTSFLRKMGLRSFITLTPRLRSSGFDQQRSAEEPGAGGVNVINISIDLDCNLVRGLFTESRLRKCINRLEILKLKYNSNVLSIFDSNFFEFEPKTRLDSKLK